MDRCDPLNLPTMLITSWAHHGINTQVGFYSASCMFCFSADRLCQDVQERSSHTRQWERNGQRTNDVSQWNEGDSRNFTPTATKARYPQQERARVLRCIKIFRWLTLSIRSTLTTSKTDWPKYCLVNENVCWQCVLLKGHEWLRDHKIFSR